jgi:ankyrin repeat protein
LIAAEKHQTSRVKRLLKRGAEIHCTNDWGQTPIHLAASHCREDTIAVLLQAGAEINAEDKSGDTPLHRAALCSSHRTGLGDIEVLIQACADVNHTNQNGRTPLHEARSKESAEALLRAGANVHARDHSNGTPLHSACSAKVAEALLRAGADVNSKNCRNLTPLHLAWYNSQWGGAARGVELAVVLVGAGADLGACADVGPDLLARADDPAWTPVAWIQRDRPGMPCTVPFGPSRSMRAAYELWVEAHAEMVLFLQGCGEEDMGGKALELEEEEKMMIVPT